MKKIAKILYFCLFFLGLYHLEKCSAFSPRKHRQPITKEAMKALFGDQPVAAAAPLVVPPPVLQQQQQQGLPGPFDIALGHVQVQFDDPAAIARALGQAQQPQPAPVILPDPGYIYLLSCVIGKAFSYPEFGEIILYRTLFGGTFTVKQFAKADREGGLHNMVANLLNFVSFDEKEWFAIDFQKHLDDLQEELQRNAAVEARLKDAWIGNMIGQFIYPLLIGGIPYHIKIVKDLLDKLKQQFARNSVPEDVILASAHIDAIMGNRTISDLLDSGVGRFTVSFRELFTNLHAELRHNVANLFATFDEIRKSKQPQFPGLLLYFRQQYPGNAANAPENYLANIKVKSAESLQGGTFWNIIRGACSLFNLDTDSLDRALQAARAATAIRRAAQAATDIEIASQENQPPESLIRIAPQGIRQRMERLLQQQQQQQQQQPAPAQEEEEYNPAPLKE